jgi:hypothetical protein
LKNSTQVEIDSLEEEIEDNNQRLDEIHSLLKTFKNNVVGGEQISVDKKKQYHLELEKEHREVEKHVLDTEGLTSEQVVAKCRKRRRKSEFDLEYSSALLIDPKILRKFI